MKTSDKIIIGDSKRETSIVELVRTQSLFDIASKVCQVEIESHPQPRQRLWKKSERRLKD